MKVDYEKAEQAVKLLEESGVNYALAYDNGGYCKTSLRGLYKDVSQCLVGAMARVAGLICDNGYDEYIAIGELQKMSITATELWYKEREEKNNG